MTLNKFSSHPSAKLKEQNNFKYFYINFCMLPNSINYYFSSEFQPP